MNDKDTIWLGRVQQETGLDIIVPATSLGVCRQRVERAVRRSTDNEDFVEEWVEGFGKGHSEGALRDSGLYAIISRRYLYHDCETGPLFPFEHPVEADGGGEP